jgi:hypothetical protein
MSDNGFEDWLDNTDVSIFRMHPHWKTVQAAYLAGIKAGMEKAEEIAQGEQFVSMDKGLHHMGYNKACNDIAAAIKEQREKL